MKKNKTKKVILFIVEGPSETLSLGSILEKLLSDKSTKFIIIGGDLTNIAIKTEKNSVFRVREKVKNFLNRSHGIGKKDILRIVHIVDTDGAFIKKEYIHINPDSPKFIYADDGIHASSIEHVLERNKRKAFHLNELISNSNILGIPYSIFFFSCNLDHVLHNNRSLKDKYKTMLAEKFADRFYGREMDFVKFINSSDFATNFDYYKSWEFIKQGTNSTNKHTNFNLFLNDYFY